MMSACALRDVAFCFTPTQVIFPPVSWQGNHDIKELSRVRFRSNPRSRLASRKVTAPPVILAEFTKEEVETGALEDALFS